ncbi:hypothetical protein HYC85_029295 [Camellia sinensis]|uniref:Neprosin PEP catalytic domain-containing protein n=1 Tax=Camellia sinensis TaxID=4442 RepID=A0A7J7G1I7_CAMSI|nr:hypothetical protein HYC85_029295 [Camellia sinensis]
MSSDHEHAVAYVNGEEYFGAKASINVWAPSVTDQYEFSLSQLWVISGTFGNDLNTIEAGWQLSGKNVTVAVNKSDNFGRQVFHRLSGWSSRLAHNYMGTTTLGSSLIGQVMHTNLLDATTYSAQALSKSTIRLLLEPQSLQDPPTVVHNLILALLFGRILRSARAGNLTLEREMRAPSTVCRLDVRSSGDPKHGHWWLQFGPGLLVGYWPSFLFSHLRSHASMVQFGGEIVNTRSSLGGGSRSHTSTQMGSGHFADEGFGKASYFRNLQVVDWDNNLIPLSNLHFLADHPTCYDIRAGTNTLWGDYFYFGGPGRNIRCP